MTTSKHALPDSCANCAHPVSGPYCSQCGQKIHIETPTLWEFIHEYLHHYIALEGALTRTLWILVTRPGRLTTEYLAGRRARYIKPLQLYLTVSFVFFIVLALSGGGALSSQDADLIKADPGEIAKLEVELKSSPANKTMQHRTSVTGLDIDETLDAFPALRERIGKRLDQFKRDPAEVSRDFGTKLRRYMPYGIFALMPIAAVLLLLVYRKRGLRYGAHLVFTLHLHTFVFLMMLLTLLPVEFGMLIPAAIFAYFVIALRRMYGGRWYPQILRSILLAGVYSVFAFASIGIIVVAAILA